MLRLYFLVSFYIISVNAAIKECVPFRLPYLPTVDPKSLWESHHNRDEDLVNYSLDDLFRFHRRWPGIRIDVQKLREFARNVIFPYDKEWGQFPQNPGYTEGQDVKEYSYWRGNGMYERTDPILMHSVIRAFKPKQVLEIGSGFSTRVAAAALVLNQQYCNTSGTLIALEPVPKRLPDPLPGLSALSEHYLETEKMAPFLDLKANDVLIIDSSHRIQPPQEPGPKGKGGRKWEDVPILFSEVVPRLQPGVIVHVHDISFPHLYKFDGPHQFGGGWHEQFALQALLQANECLDLLWHGNGLSDKWLKIHGNMDSSPSSLKHNATLRKSITDEAIEAFKGETYYTVNTQSLPYAGGGSLWARRNDKPCYHGMGGIGTTSRNIGLRNLTTSDIFKHKNREWVGWNWPKTPPPVHCQKSQIVSSSFSTENDVAILGSLVKAKLGKRIVIGFTKHNAHDKGGGGGGSPQRNQRRRKRNWNGGRRLMYNEELKNDSKSVLHNHSDSSDDITYHRSYTNETRRKLSEKSLSNLRVCAGSTVKIEEFKEDILEQPLSYFLALQPGDALLLPDASYIDWSSRATLAILLEIAPRLPPGVFLALGNVHAAVLTEFTGGGQFIVQAMGTHNVLFKPLWPTKEAVNVASAEQKELLIILERR